MSQTNRPGSWYSCRFGKYNEWSSLNECRHVWLRDKTLNCDVFACPIKTLNHQVYSIGIVRFSQHLNQKVDELFTEWVSQQMILQHQTVIVEPDLFVEIFSVKSFTFVKRNDPFVLIIA